MKCDERKPVCERCHRADRECIGHGFGDDFEEDQEEGEQPSALFTRASELLFRPMPRLPQFDSSGDLHDILELIPRINANLLTTSDSCTKAVWVSASTYLRFLPCRSGHNEALDAAVACIGVAVRKL